MMNNLDLAIISAAIGSFLLFIIFQSLSFRFINQKMVIKWLILSYLFTCLGFLLFGLGLFHLSIIKLGSTFAIWLSMSLTIYTLLTINYILGFFGVAISSIRMQLLFQIGKTQSKGISKKKLLEKFNARTIITNRLDRFVSSGELGYKSGTYFYQRHLSYFYIHGIIQKRLKVWYSSQKS